MPNEDAAYLEALLAPIRVSRSYRPRFGRRSAAGLAFADFRSLYAADPFYSWLGLDTRTMYAAHRAAGGVTSLYRQIGIGCERLVRTVLGDTFSLPEEATRWSYKVAEPSSGPRPSSRQRVVSLDAGLPLDRIPDSEHRRRVESWLTRCADSLDIDRRLVASLRTIVFEIRQGYKSKDSKRQLADIANAAAAYTQCCLPCLLVLSRQIDEDVASRYRANRWLVLTGVTGLDDPLRSTYDFMAEVVGFDLAAFFSRHTDTLRSEIDGVVRTLLETRSPD